MCSLRLISAQFDVQLVPLFSCRSWHKLVSPWAVLRVYGAHLANEGKRLFRADSFDRSSVVTPAENAEVYELFMRKLQPLYTHGDRSNGSGLVDDPQLVLRPGIPRVLHTPRNVSTRRNTIVPGAASGSPLPGSAGWHQKRSCAAATWESETSARPYLRWRCRTQPPREPGRRTGPRPRKEPAGTHIEGCIQI